LIPKSLLLRLLVPAALVLTGTLGYRLIEGWSYFDSLYMTVTTLSTVGFSEMHGLSSTGRAFTIFLILGGVFTLFYVASDLIRFIVGGELHDFWGRQHMEQQLAGLHRHVIVCGYGRVGRLVNPEPETLLEAGDILVAIGSQEQLTRLETLTNPPAGEAVP
jgi:voltage-gated potassium channel